MWSGCNGHVRIGPVKTISSGIASDGSMVDGSHVAWEGRRIGWVCSFVVLLAATRGHICVVTGEQRPNSSRIHDEGDDRQI